MRDLWIMLEVVLTLPGRIIAWFNWALPYGGYSALIEYRNDEVNESRAIHWMWSLAFYFVVGSTLFTMWEIGLLQAVIRDVKTIWAARQGG